MRIITDATGWVIKHIKQRKIPKTEMTYVETHKSHLPKDWRNRLLKGMINENYN